MLAGDLPARRRHPERLSLPILAALCDVPGRATTTRARLQPRSVSTSATPPSSSPWPLAVSRTTPRAATRLPPPQPRTPQPRHPASTGRIAAICRLALEAPTPVIAAALGLPPPRTARTSAPQAPGPRYAAHEPGLLSALLTAMNTKELKTQTCQYASRPADRWIEHASAYECALCVDVR
jgi:hypothetical protein